MSYVKYLKLSLSCLEIMCVYSHHINKNIHGNDKHLFWRGDHLWWKGEAIRLGRCRRELELEIFYALNLIMTTKAFVRLVYLLSGKLEIVLKKQNI